MPNGYVFVDLDKERKLRFDFNALADVEKILGAGVGEIFSEKNMGFGTIRGLYWAGLKWQDKGLTLDRTGLILQKAITEGKTSLQQLGADITEAMFASGLVKRPEEPVEDLETDDTEEDGENPKN